MASSGTRTFNLFIDEIIEESYERIGLESQTGYDYRTARRSLNLLLTEWVSRDVHLWTMNLATLVLTTGTQSYTLPTTVIDVVDAARRDNTTSDEIDSPMWHISLQEYLSARTNKATIGPVTHYAVERNSAGGHTMYTWPATDDGADQIIYWALQYIEDVSATGGDQTAEVPKRFLPALTSGLAYRLGLKKTKEMLAVYGSVEAVALKMAQLKSDYDETFNMAKEGDRERSSFIVTPFIGYL